MRFRRAAGRIGLPRMERDGWWDAALLVCSLCLVWIAFLQPKLSASRMEFLDNHILEDFTQSGEALIHGVPPTGGGLSDRMPLSCVVGAIIFNHGGMSWRRAWPPLQYLALLLLVFAFNALSGSMALGLAGVLVFCLQDTGSRGYPQSSYAVLFMSVACLLSWRARAPSFWRNSTLGIAVGVSILFRPSLILFLPLLAVYEHLAVYRCSLRASWKPLLPLIVIPGLFLVPVLVMNRALGRGTLLEDGPIFNNIVTGALGIVPGLSHGWQDVAPGGPSFSSWVSVLTWAVRTILEHPIRYAASVLERLAQVAATQPWVMLMAVVSVFCHPGRQSLKQPALLAAYFVGVHCLMSTQEYYFVPLWPLLAVLAPHFTVPLAIHLRRRSRPIGAVARYAAFGGSVAGGVWPAVFPGWLAAALCLTAPANRRTLARRAGMGIVSAVFLPSLALSGYAMMRAVRYGMLMRSGAGTKPEAFDAAVAASPADAWLLARRGEMRLGQGDHRGAVEDYTRAVALQPWRDDRRIDLAWVQMLDGRALPLRSFRSHWSREDFPVEHDYLGAKLHVARFAHYRRLGRKEQAKDELFSALGVWQAMDADFLSITGAGDKTDAVSLNLRRLASMEGMAPLFADQVTRFYCSHLLSSDDKLALVGFLSDAWPENRQLSKLRREMQLDWLDGRMKPGDSRGVPAVLRALERGAETPGQKLVVAARYLKFDDRRGFIALARSLVARGGGDVDAAQWLALAQDLMRLGDRGLSLRALRRAEAARSGPREKVAIVQFYDGLGESAHAQGLVLAIAKEGPGHLAARQWLDYAPVAAKAGMRGLALQALSHAHGSRPSEREEAEIADRCFDYGDPSRCAAWALAVIESGSDGVGAEGWTALGRRLAANGERTLALRSLGHAERSRPAARAKMEALSLYAELGEAGPVRRLADDIIRQGQGVLSPQEWMELAKLAGEAGARDLAERSLVAAEGAGPSKQQRARIAVLHLHDGNRERFLERARSVVETGAADVPARAWISWAREARDLGDAGLALQALARVKDERLTTEDRVEIAKLYVGMGKPREVLRGKAGSLLRAQDWIAVAMSAAQAGDRATALEALGRAQSRSVTPAELLGVIKAFSGMGEERRALPAARMVAKGETGGIDAHDWLEVARAAVKGGDPAAARAALSRAEATGALAAWESVEAARLHWEVKEGGRAVVLIRRTVESGGEGLTCGQWLELSRVAQEAGDREVAVRALERAGGALPKPEERWMLAMRYQGLKEHGRALGILDALVKEDPGKSVYLSDRGILRWLMGDPVGAVADLREARRLEPARMETVLSLGSVLESAERPREALKLYDDALGSGPSATSIVAKRIRRERERLAAKMKALQGRTR